MYPVSESPPSESGALHVTVTCSLSTVATMLLGLPGTVLFTGGATGVTEPEESDEAPEPAGLDADTAKVYGWPFARPVNTVELASDFTSTEVRPGLTDTR